SVAAAIAGTLIFATQPDVLYLQATPMTEALLMATTVLGVALTWRWVDRGGSDSPMLARVVLAGARLTRYEAWPITPPTVGLAALALLLMRPARPFSEIVRRVALLASLPIAAVVAFVIFSRITVGSWLVTDGFFLIDNPSYHRPLKALAEVGWALKQLNG